MDIINLLAEKGKCLQDKPAIIFKEQTIPFSQLKDTVFRLADSLTKLGVKKGDKVAIYLPNCPEYIFSYSAVWCLGATAVPLDFMLTEEELISCISHAEAKILLAKPKPNLSFSMFKDKCPGLEEIVLTDENRSLFLSFTQLIEKGSGQLKAREIPDKDYACIFYTSGSTGKPKGVLCNYKQLGASPMAMSYFVDLNDKDIALCGAVPFSHLGGLVYIFSILFLGTTVVLTERFIPVEFLKLIQQYKVTCFWLVPSMYYAILQLKEFETFDLSSLHWIDVFGAPSSADQLRRFHKYCPQAELYHGWGMTETQGPSIVTPKGSDKIESVGRPAPWLEVKIFDSDDRELPAGQIGEIVLRSWVVSDGYYKDPEATKEAMRNGWFHTGDLGRFDAEGFFYIVGRKKEMIKVGGEIVFEPEVEAAIHKHPEVAEVAVVGVPDKLRGEVPKAFVALKAGSSITEQKIRYFCREHLAHFKVPHYFEFVQQLPKNRAGKVDKEKLRPKLC